MATVQFASMQNQKSARSGWMNCFMDASIVSSGMATVQLTNFNQGKSWR